MVIEVAPPQGTFSYETALNFYTHHTHFLPIALLVLVLLIAIISLVVHVAASLEFVHG
jgi:hypothetical protein